MLDGERERREHRRGDHVPEEMETSGVGNMNCFTYIESLGSYGSF